MPRYGHKKKTNSTAPPALLQAPVGDPRTGLWNQAYNYLRSDKEALVKTYEAVLVLDLEEASSSDPEPLTCMPTEKQMSALITKKLAAMNSRQWRINLGRKSIEIRHEVDRILKIVTVAKDFGSSLASIDPVHARIPWARVCVLLPVIQCERLFSGQPRLTFLTTAALEQQSAKSNGHRRT